VEVQTSEPRVDFRFHGSGQLHASSSLCLRCVGIDREFERLLEEIFGAEFISLFKARRPAGWVDLMIAFESRKRAADPNKDQPLNVSLPFSLIDFHKKHFVSRHVTIIHNVYALELAGS